ncbi:MAG: hypothetical protein AABY07_06080 [Nanoarchaeota archaeon]
MKNFQKIALDRIRILFKLARENAVKHSDRSNRYVKLAKKIAMKARVKMPREFRRRYCKNCLIYLISGKNCRVRTRERKLIIYCFKCRGFMRMPLGSK